LNTYRELEDAIAEDPFDEARWIVLEDWLLERDDPRAALIQLEKQGLSTQALLATMAPLLLGDKHEQLDAQLYQRDWRAGFLRQCQFTGTPELFATFLASPASALLRAVTFTVLPQNVTKSVEPLRGALCLRSLRVITLSSWSAYHPVKMPRVGAERLDVLPNLDHLVLRGLYIDRPIDVRALTLAPMSPDVSWIGAALAGHRWTELRELTYELPPLLGEPLELADLAALAKHEVAPKLERLTIRNVPDYRIATVTALLEMRGVELTLTAG
jgi:uncharacterized protein (TIGR02996 family)